MARIKARSQRVTGTRGSGWTERAASRSFRTPVEAEPRLSRAELMFGRERLARRNELREQPRSHGFKNAQPLEESVKKYLGKIRLALPVLNELNDLGGPQSKLQRQMNRAVETAKRMGLL
jgi:hypothetical protein